MHAPAPLARLVPIWWSTLGMALLGGIGYLILIPCVTISGSTTETGFFPSIRKHFPESLLLSLVMFGAPGIAYLGYRLWRHPGWPKRSITARVAGRLLLAVFCLSWLGPYFLGIYGIVAFLLQ